MGSVLFVEDEESIRNLATQFLRGHEVATASDGIEALAHIDTHGAPNLVITDVTMANMNGMTLARELDERNIPYAFITGHPHGTVQDNFGSPIPEANFLPKPFDLGKMRSLVDHYSNP